MIFNPIIYLYSDNNGVTATELRIQTNNDHALAPVDTCFSMRSIMLQYPLHITSWLAAFVSTTPPSLFSTEPEFINDHKMCMHACPPRYQCPCSFEWSFLFFFFFLFSFLICISNDCNNTLN